MLRFLFCALAALPVAALAQPGSLDPTFSNDGITMVNVSGSAVGSSVAPGEDGTVYTLGEVCENAACSLLLARFLPNGAPDASFGTRGRLATALTELDVALSVFPLGDGTSLTLSYDAGDDLTRGDLWLTRRLADGSLDPTFGTNGAVSASPPLRELSYGGAHRLADGRILVAGRRFVSSRWSSAVIRLLPSGELDPAFGAGGVAATDPDDDYRFLDVTETSGGRILVVGSAGEMATRSLALFAYNADGEPDVSFGVDGVASVGRVGQQSSGSGVVETGEGAFVVTGFTRESESADDRLLLARFTSDGALDATFGDSGVLVEAFGVEGDVSGNDLIETAGGRLVVAGRADHPQRGSGAVMRVLANGTPDSGFGEAGISWVDPSIGGALFDIAAAPGNLALVAGFSGRRAPFRHLVARFDLSITSTPTPPPPSASPLAVSLAPNPTRHRLTIRARASSPVRAVVFDALGRQVAAGETFVGETSFAVTGWPAGVYTVRATTPTETVVERFTVAR